MNEHLSKKRVMKNDYETIFKRIRASDQYDDQGENSDNMFVSLGHPSGNPVSNPGGILRGNFVSDIACYPIDIPNGVSYGPGVSLGNPGSNSLYSPCGDALVNPCGIPIGNTSGNHGGDQCGNHGGVQDEIWSDSCRSNNCITCYKPQEEPVCVLQCDKLDVASGEYKYLSSRSGDYISPNTSYGTLCLDEHTPMLSIEGSESESEFSPRQACIESAKSHDYLKSLPNAIPTDMPYLLPYPHREFPVLSQLVIPTQEQCALASYILSFDAE